MVEDAGTTHRLAADYVSSTSTTRHMAAITRDLSAARAAYASGDIDASKQAHGMSCSEAGHDGKPQSVFGRSVVVGGYEGMLITSVLLVVASQSGLPLHTNLQIVLSCLVALSLAAGMRDYIQLRSDYAHYHREKKREEWELKHCPEGEKKEMIELYVGKGMSEQDATTVIETMSKYDEFFVDVMMCQELVMIPPETNILINAVATSLSCVVFGLLPVAVVAGCRIVARSASFSTLIPSVLSMSYHPVFVAVTTAAVTTLSLSAVNARVRPSHSRWTWLMLTAASYCVVAVLSHYVSVPMTRVVSWLLTTLQLES